jgi:hypothetical protein
MKRILFLALFVLCLAPSFAQRTGFAVGYNFGRFSQPLRNMEVMTYEFNQSHPNYTDHYHFHNLFQGIEVAWFSENENGGFEAMWSNRHIRSDAVGADNPGDTVYKHQLKVRQNMLSFGVYKPFGDFFKVGIDYDIGGFCRFYKRIGPRDDFKSAKWENLFDKKGFLVFGFTPFIELGLGPVKIRPYYQWVILQGETHYGELKDYAFKTSNYGVMGYLAIGKKN